MDATDGFGADSRVGAADCQAHDVGGHEHPELTTDSW